MPTDVKTGQPIYAGAPSVGLRNVGSYQVAGEPWITGSDDHAANQVKRYQFPFVSKEISVTNIGAAKDDMNYIFVHFVSGSGDGHSFSGKGTGPVTRDAKSDVFTGKHFVTLSGSQSVTFKAKAKEIYISTDVTVGDIAAGDLGGGSAADVVHYRILADLTNVPTRRMYHLTGSGFTETLLTA